MKTGLPQNTVSDIVQDHQGYLWFATHVGVARYDGYTFEHFNLSDGLPNEVIAYEEKDDLGMFAFENVPDGDYFLIVDVPGLPMLQTYEVEIMNSRILYGLDFLVKKKGIETSGIVDVETSELDNFMIFPNPGNGLLHIEFTASSNYSVAVYNMVGELVDSREYLSVVGLVVLDITELQSGMYLIKIAGDQGVETVKYLKK